MNLDQAEKFLSHLPIRDKQSQKLIPFLFNPSQRKLHAALKAQQAKKRPMRAVVLKARRQGISTYTDNLLAVHGMARDGTNAMIVTHDFKSSKELFKNPKTLLTESLPQQKTLKSTLNLPAMTQHKIVFPHAQGDSYLTIATAGNVEGGRGMTLTDLHASEAAFYPGEGAFAALLPTVPNSLDTIIVIETTANGRVGIGQPFFDFWESTVAGQTEFTHVFLSWLEDPTCVDYDHDVSDAPIDDEEKLLMTEFGASPQQISWRRITIDSPACRGRVEIFDQEYPRCVTSETLISTENGILPIGDANNCQQSESGEIKAWGPQPIANIFRLTTKQGRVLRGTGDHPVAVIDGFINLSLLEPGQLIELCPPRFSESTFVKKWQDFPGIETSLTVDRDWAKFIGYFMGDGCWYKGNLSIVCDEKDEDVIEDARSVISNLFREPYSRVHRKVQGKKGAVEWRLGITSCLPAFTQIGILDHKEDFRYVRKIHVPECIFRSPKEIVREFLRALFECDGSASRNKVRFGSSYLKFVQDIQLLLLGFGINSRILANPKFSGSRQTFLFYELGLNVEASKLFHDVIGFIGKRKSTLRPLDTHLGRPSDNVLQDEVLKVEDEGVAELTFNLTVGESQVFSANGILTHNTPEVAFISTGEPAFTREEMAKARVTVRPALEQARIFMDGNHVKYERDNTSALHIWEKPVASHRYYLGVDAARGTEDGDFAAIVGFNGDSGEQCLRYQQRIDPELLAYTCYCIGMYFNKAMLCIELTGNLGMWCQSRLRDYYHYPNLYRWRGGRDDKARPGMNKGGSYGWETGWRSRERAMIGFREAVKHEMIYVRDEEIVRQMDLCTRRDFFVRWDIKHGHDDVLMATLLGNISRSEWHVGKISGPSNQALTTDADEKPLRHLGVLPSFETIASMTAQACEKFLAARKSYKEGKRRPLDGI